MSDQLITITNIVFIDAAVPDYQTLIAGLTDNSTYFVLDAQKDGVAQIEQFLAGYSNLDSIQILSHGSQGSLYLGNTVLSSNTLKKYQDQLASIGSHLKDRGDILLYGCNVAAGQAGLDFINQFAVLTNADVAASNDITGSSVLGGNWQLETNTGAIEARNNLSSNAINNYLGVFSTNTSPTFTLSDGIAITEFGLISKGQSVSIQTDGKILVSGESIVVPQRIFAVVRYNADGSLGACRIIDISV